MNQKKFHPEIRCQLDLKPSLNRQRATQVWGGLLTLALSLANLSGTAFAQSSSQPSSQPSSTTTACPTPALSRILRHRVTAGETLASIAQQYNLLPTTLMGMNPALRQGTVQPGSEILVPPYNGIRVTVPAGQSWRDLAKQYGVRADLLFEQNGCQTAPTVLFVPGVNWSPAPPPTANQAAAGPISHYPLPETAEILQAHGWQVNPVTNAVEFHSGVDLAVQSPMPVLAAGAGIVAFAGEQNGVDMVVINHSQGLQTRYAQLDTIAVKLGQQVQAGTELGTVGAAAVQQPSLNFQVRSNSRLGWVAQDPAVYLQELGVGNLRR